MADKKISELPLITTVSGSIVFVPIVHDGITEKITIQNFSKYTSQYSAHTGSAGNVFTGPQTINNNVTITGNQSVNGNVTINGRLTVYEVVAQYETASILFSTGSTKLGDQITDRHEFTGSTNITGSFLVNGANLSDFSASNSTLFTNYSSSVSESISSYSASNSTVFTNFSSSNAVISQIYSASNSTTFTNLSSSNSTTFTNFSSSNAVISQTISASNSTTFTNYSSSVSQSISSYSASNSTTFTNYSSSNSTTFTTYSSSVSESISSYSASNSTTFTNFSSSNAVISQTYSASNSTTFTNFSSSNAVISQTYSASNSTTFTNYSSSTATSINNVSTGVGSELSRVYQTTASLNTQTGSQGNLNAQIGIATGSLNAFTGSQIGKDGTLAIVTSSLRAEIGGIEAYTASLKSAIVVNGNNVTIIGELSASRIYTEYITSSVLFVTGSNRIGDQSTDKHEFTGSVHINDTLFIKGIAQGTGELNVFTGSQINKDFTLSVVTSSLNAFTGSQINKDFTLSVVTSSLNAQTGSQQNLNAQIGIATGSLNSTTASLIGITNELMALTASMKGQAIVSSSTQIQNYDVFALNSNLYNGTGSIKGEIAGIEAYTASLKGAAIVSSSQQVQNYFTFAKTGSANTFYGTQTFASSGGSGLRVYGAAGTHQWDVYLNSENLRISDNTAGDAALVVDTRASFTGPVTASALNLTKSPDGIFAELGGNTPKLNLYKFSSGNVMNIGHNYYYDGVAYGKNDISLQGWEFRSHITNGQYTISHSPAAVTTLNQLIKIDANTGDLTITNGNLVVASGKGIDFSATSNGSGTTSSELLNDYEEGTWTGTMIGTVTNPTTPVTATGTYTKIGRQVTAQIAFVAVDTTGAAGGVRVTGLPFATSGLYVGSVILEFFDFTAGRTSAACYTNNGTPTTIFIEASGDDTSFGGVAHTAGTGRYLYATLTYFV